jgi:carnitine O-acetyltransferase
MGRLAISSQAGYMANAVNGKGVDRHFLGLKKCLAQNEPMPAIFTDPLFARSCHWNLSTSQISSEYFVGYGWGQVVDDGYGVAYMV